MWFSFRYLEALVRLSFVKMRIFQKPLTSIPSNSGAQSVGAVNRLPGANNAKGEG